MAENTKTIVLDASFLLCFLLPDENDPLVTKIFQEYKYGTYNFIAPFLLSFEIANSLNSAIHARRIKKITALQLLRTYQNLDIEFKEIPPQEMLNTAVEKNISVYDASYIWLAKKERTSLFTLDNKLKNKI